MSFGMDSTGFTKKSLADIKTSLEEEITAVFGPINSSPESVFGQIIGVFAEAESELWDLAEAVYLSQYPVSAEGVQLDNAVDLTGITRLEASSSFATAIFEGTEGTIIPVGSQIKQLNTNELFENATPLTITKNNVLQIVITVNSVQDSTDYSVTIDGTLNEITSDASATEEEIIDALKVEIQANMTDHSVSVNPAGTILTVYITDKTTSFTADKSSLLDMDIWSPQIVFSVNKGALSVPANSLTTIETPVSGWNDVDNLKVGQLGRDDESDDDLRIRRKQSLRVSGAATVPAIEARLFQEVDGVDAVIVVENRTDITDSEGLPPHSFEAIISGGQTQDIVDKLWEIKPAGIQTYGSESGQVLDSQGILQTLYFSRPVDKYVHMEIEISLYDEEQFPTDGVNAIKQAIVDFGDTFNTGDDLIVQRFYTPIYTIPGILDIVSLKFGITENPGDSVTSLQSGTNNAVSPDQLVDTVTNAFITNGVVSGMCAKNVSDSTYASIKQVVSESILDLSSDIFTASPKSYDVGLFAQINIPLASDELAKFAVDRIDVTIV